jgi:hypothetical protein
LARVPGVTVVTGASTSGTMEAEEPKPEAVADVWACKPTLKTTSNAASVTRTLSDFENKFSMGNRKNKKRKLKP